MADRIFLRLSDKYALGADDLQWIVYRSRRKVPSPLDEPLKYGRGSEWEAVSFVRSTKEILLARCGQITCDEAQVALAGYPSTFDAWKGVVPLRSAAPRPIQSSDTQRLGSPLQSNLEGRAWGQCDYDLLIDIAKHGSGSVDGDEETVTAAKGHYRRGHEAYRAGVRRIPLTTAADLFFYRGWHEARLNKKSAVRPVTEELAHV
jgi:hypothetical protein